MDLRETRWRAREIKFLANASMRPALVEWARTHLEPDGHGTGVHADEYATSTLYFETKDFDVYRRRGSYGRSKYRVRQYGGSNVVFLERKFRTERLLAKRRTIVPISDLDRLAADTPDRSWDGFWFHRRIALRRLRPLIQLSYDRVARIGASSTGPVRLTLDTNLRALPLPDCAFLPGIGLPFLEGFCVMEVKYRVSIPAIFRQLMETFGLQVQKMSKFRSGMRALDYPLPPDPNELVPVPVGVGTSFGADESGAFAD